MPFDYLYTVISSSYYAVHRDIVLAEAVLVSPLEEEIICENIVELEWSSVAGADFYIVQWCQNTSFTGPTLDVIKVVGTNTVNLTTASNQVRRGFDYYWRVIPYNNTGGGGPSSEIRKFSLLCNKDLNLDPVDCTQAQAEIELKADKEAAERNSLVTILASYSYAGTLGSFSWSVESGDGTIVGSDSTTCQVLVDACATQDIVVRLTLIINIIGTPNLECYSEITIGVVQRQERYTTGTPAGCKIRNGGASTKYLMGYMYSITQDIDGCGSGYNYLYQPFFQWPEVLDTFMYNVVTGVHMYTSNANLYMTYDRIRMSVYQHSCDIMTIKMIENLDQGSIKITGQECD